RSRHRQPRHQAGAVPRPDGRDHAGRPHRGRVHHQPRRGETPQGRGLQGQAGRGHLRQRQEIPRQVRPGALPVKRETIVLGAAAADQAKQIVVELINGPLEKGLLPTLPPQTRLRGLYLDRSGTAYVDFSSELVDFHPGGTDEEIATIFSIVDSLVYNLPQIKRVHILVNGEERDTLKSHLDLRRDYAKDMSIVDMDRKRAP